MPLLFSPKLTRSISNPSSLNNRIRLVLGMFLLFFSNVFAQIPDRYPVLQCPTETSATIAWRTAVNGTGTIDYGLSPGNLAFSLSDPNPTQKHAYPIDNLLPNTQYYYQVSTNTGFLSSVESFYTAKPASVRQLRFLHYGDCGYNNTMQNQVAGWMEQQNAEFAVVAGDVDQGVGDSYESKFFGVYADMLKSTCHYTALGNHDIIADGGSTYLDAFVLPTNNPQQVENYYTFTWGNCKFICLDSNIPYNIGSDQHNFLLDELKCNDREWLFVFFHHPPWTNAWDFSYYIPFQPFYQYEGNVDMRSDLVPYFEQYGVDYVLNGHAHCYQRGIYNGVHYLISGGAGTTTLDMNTNSNSPNIQKEAYVNHFVRFDVQGDTIIYLAIDLNGQVIDSVWHTKTWAPYEALIAHTDDNGIGDGTANLTVNGPRPPYSVSWSNGDTTLSITGLIAGTYIATITDANGCVKIDSVVISLITGMDGALSQNNGVKFYPNPFSVNATLEFSNPNGAVYQLDLIDLNGKIIRKLGETRGEKFLIDRNELSNGIYLYRLLRGNGEDVSRPQANEGKAVRYGKILVN